MEFKPLDHHAIIKLTIVLGDKKMSVSQVIPTEEANNTIVPLHEQIAYRIDKMRDMILREVE